ncbi:MAG: transcriptional regulator, partial [Candidatus Bathyarchaeia archaeon]
GNLSSHMSRLEAAGLINVEKEFVDKKPNTRLSLTKEGRQAFSEYKDRMRHLFSDP